MKKNLWVQSSYESINYSDGDAVEQRIYNIIQEVTDLLPLSLALRQYCTDWPSTYHLTANCANLLRPFGASLKGADVFEIGAACGAIT